MIQKSISLEYTPLHLAATSASAFDKGTSAFVKEDLTPFAAEKTVTVFFRHTPLHPHSGVRGFCWFGISSAT